MSENERRIETGRHLVNEYVQHVYGRATSIIYGEEDKVVSHTSYGYRKYTTGEYVPNAYRANFGWKNTYYQPAITVVMLKTEEECEP